MKYTVKERLRYYFENTISAGPIGVIKWLGLISLASILFLGLVIIIFGIKDDPGMADLAAIEAGSGCHGN